MSNTVRIFRNLSALRSCRNVFSLKYCTSHKDDKDSGVNNDVDDNSGNDAIAQGNKTIQQGADSETSTSKVLSSIIGIIKKSKDNSLERRSLIPLEKSDPSSTEQSSSSGSDSDSSTEDEIENKENITFKDFMSKVESGLVLESEDKKSISGPETFASLLRKSPLMELGDPVDKLVVGTINIIVDEEAYIDFGWKFPAVCELPKKRVEGFFKPGTKVIIKIKDLELTTKFLGDKEYTSLLEADCQFVSLYEKGVTVK